MTENFDFAALAKRWRHQEIPGDIAPSAADLAQAGKRQRRWRLLMFGEWLAAAVAAATACWMLFSFPGLLGSVSAVFLTVAALSGCYVSWYVHRQILRYDSWSSSGLVRFHCRACRATLQYYRYTQFSCAGLILFTAVLYSLHWWQLAEVPTILLLFYGLLMLPLCLFTIYRLQQKALQKAAELQRLSALAQDFRS